MVGFGGGVFWRGGGLSERGLWLVWRREANTKEEPSDLFFAVFSLRVLLFVVRSSAVFTLSHGGPCRTQTTQNALGLLGSRSGVLSSHLERIPRSISRQQEVRFGGASKRGQSTNLIGIWVCTSSPLSLKNARQQVAIKSIKFEKKRNCEICDIGEFMNKKKTSPSSSRRGTSSVRDRVCVPSSPAPCFYKSGMGGGLNSQSGKRAGVLGFALWNMSSGSNFLHNTTARFWRPASTLRVCWMNAGRLRCVRVKSWNKETRGVLWLVVKISPSAVRTCACCAIRGDVRVCPVHVLAWSRCSPWKKICARAVSLCAWWSKGHVWYFLFLGLWRNRRGCGFVCVSVVVWSVRFVCGACLWS